MANILMVSFYFPPSNSIACRRIYSWAKHLKQMGHNITVLTAFVQQDHKVINFEIDPSFTDIHYIKYFDILRFLKKIFNINEPISDDVIKMNDKSVKSLKIVIAEKIKNFFMSLSDKGIFFGGARMPTFSDQWLFAAYKIAKKIIKKQNIEIIITSSPPPVVNLIGYKLKKKFRNIKWIADFRDLWTQNPTHKGFPFFSQIENLFEKRCMEKFDATTVVSEIWVEWLKKKYPNKKSEIFRLENGYDKELYNSSNSKLSLKNKQEKTIIYSGTLYANRRDPELLFQAVNNNLLLLKRKMKIIFYGGPETKAVLKKNYKLYKNIADIIEFKGYISAKESISVQQSADSLLFIDRDLENDGTLPAKIFEYMVYEKPILCVGIDRGSYIGELMNKTGLCYFCGNDIQRIEDFLLKLLRDEIMVKPNLEYIKQFDRKNQVMKLNDIIHKQLNI